MFPIFPMIAFDIPQKLTDRGNAVNVVDGINIHLLDSRN